MDDDMDVVVADMAGQQPPFPVGAGFPDAIKHQVSLMPIKTNILDLHFLPLILQAIGIGIERRTFITAVITIDGKFRVPVKACAMATERDEIRDGEDS